MMSGAVVMDPFGNDPVKLERELLPSVIQVNHYLAQCYTNACNALKGF